MIFSPDNIVIDNVITSNSAKYHVIYWHERVLFFSSSVLLIFLLLCFYLEAALGLPRPGTNKYYFEITFSGHSLPNIFVQLLIWFQFISALGGLFYSSYQPNKKLALTIQNYFVYVYFNDENEHDFIRNSLDFLSTLINCCFIFFLVDFSWTALSPEIENFGPIVLMEFIVYTQLLVTYICQGLKLLKPNTYLYLWSLVRWSLSIFDLPATWLCTYIFEPIHNMIVSIPSSCQYIYDNGKCPEPHNRDIYFIISEEY
jgi:hypothetical protein